ncbi:MAG TPA: tRNA pseudouridine(55) synthase TruB, partial [Pilimelia sp.]|nr:tRNA pseudouridine(55) synthase TruB [Pilimelia sp.]
VLVVAVGRATRLLTYVIGADKSYTGTIRLGQSTLTDDAEGEVVADADAGAVTDAAVAAALARFVGEINQVPTAVSAIKVDGVRSYRRVRAGEAVDLPPRRVTVHALTVGEVRRPAPRLVDVDIALTCSSGTYVRAVARDLGTALGVGGHLTALRRTAVGGFTLAEAATLDQLAAQAEDGPVTGLPMAHAARRFLPARQVSTADAAVLAHGGPLPPAGIAGAYGAFGPEGDLLAVLRERAGRARPEVVFAPA